MAETGPATARRTIDPLSLSMGVAFAVIWSSAFTSARIALEDSPPFLFLAARFGAAGLGAVLIALVAGQRLPRERHVWWLITVFGLCQNTLYLGFNFWGMTMVPAGLAAIIAASLPLIVAAFSRLFLGERLHWTGLFGLVIGFAGVIVIMGGRVAEGVAPFGIGLCVAGAVALAVATLLMRNVSAGQGLLMVVGLQMLVGAVTLAPVAYLLESIEQVRWTATLGYAFAYQALLPGIAATLVWFALVGRIGATAASAFHFLNPAFGVGIAAVLLGETLTLTDAGGVLMVTSAIIAVQLSKAKSVG